MGATYLFESAEWSSTKSVQATDATGLAFLCDLVRSLNAFVDARDWAAACAPLEEAIARLSDGEFDPRSRPYLIGWQSYRQYAPAPFTERMEVLRALLTAARNKTWDAPKSRRRRHVKGWQRRAEKLRRELNDQEGSRV